MYRLILTTILLFGTIKILTFGKEQRNAEVGGMDMVTIPGQSLFKAYSIIKDLVDTF